MRASVLANQVGCPLHLCSLSSSAAVDIVSKRKELSCVLTGEVTPAALACDGSIYWDSNWRKAAAHVCSPPLRKDQAEELVEVI